MRAINHSAPPAPGLLPVLYADQMAMAGLHGSQQVATDDGGVTQRQIARQLGAGGVGKCRVQAVVQPAAIAARPLAGAGSCSVDCRRTGEQAPPVRSQIPSAQACGTQLRASGQVVARRGAEAPGCLSAGAGRQC